MELSDSHIIIRPYEANDIDNFFEAAKSSTREVGKWLAWCHENYSVEETADWITRSGMLWENGEEFNFIIMEKSSGKLIGGCGLNRFDHENLTANLGYWIRTGYTGRGYAASASILTARFGFEELRLNRIEIIAAIENLQSIRVAEKTGALRETVLRNRLLINGAVHDALLYSLIAEDIIKKTKECEKFGEKSYIAGEK